MPAVDIPPEIVDSIVDDLRTDLSTLQQCSYVSPAFLASCQRHLFASITLASAFHCERLLLVLSSNPKIVSNIRKLHITNSGWEDGIPYFSSVLQLLADCGRLQTFRFEQPPPSMTRIFKGRRFPFPISSAMKNLFASPQLNTIILQDVPLCSFPMDVLAVTPSLRHLTFTGTCYQLGCAKSAIPDKNSTRSTPWLHLHSLDLRAHHSLHVVKYFGESLSQLCKLRISVSEFKQCSECWELIKFATNTLVSLRWDDDRHVKYTVTPTNLRILPTLRLFVFELFMLSQRINILAASGLPRSIVFFAPILFCNVLNPKYDHSRPDLDGELFKLLTPADAYPYLRGVHLIMIVSYNSSAPSREAVERHFPRLRETGLLTTVICSAEEVDAALDVLEAAVQR